MRHGFVVSFALAALMGTACRDAVDPPVAARRGLATAGSPAARLTSLVAPVERDTPLAADVSWSFEVGPAGGATTHPGTGLTFRVPAEALAEDVTITITALAGRPVAYRFDPHGLVFARSATLTQDLRGTTAAVPSVLPLIGAYFATEQLELTADGLVAVTETVTAVTNPLALTATFPVRHFSGYILASGRAESDSTDGAY